MNLVEEAIHQALTDKGMRPSQLEAAARKLFASPPTIQGMGFILKDGTILKVPGRHDAIREAFKGWGYAYPAGFPEEEYQEGTNSGYTVAFQDFCKVAKYQIIPKFGLLITKVHGLTQNQIHPLVTFQGRVQMDWIDNKFMVKSTKNYFLPDDQDVLAEDLER